MHFGIALDLGAGPSVGERLRQLNPVLAAAEAGGFGSVWIGESYATGPSDPRRFHLPNALMAAVAIGAQTSLPVGTGVNLLRAWHPLRFAYDAALADQLLAGRLTVGLGLGPAPLEDRFGPRASGADAVDGFINDVRAAWKPGRAGAWPRPVGENGPRMLIGGGVPRAARRAARLGDGFYSSSGYSLQRLRPLVETYLDELAASPGQARVPIVAVNRITVVAEHAEEARKLGREHAAVLVRTYQELGTWTAATNGDLTKDRTGEIALIGTPPDVVAQVERYREVGVTDVYFRVAMGALPVPAAVRTIELLSQVLPMNG